MPKKTRTTPAKRRKPSKRKKTVYRIANWAAYNASLVQRGDLMIWISDEVVAGWKREPSGPRQRGGQVQYSDRAIECLLMLKAVFRLPYRQTEGLGRSVLGLLEAEVAVPDYTTLCKRSASLEVRAWTCGCGQPATSLFGRSRLVSAWRLRLRAAVVSSRRRLSPGPLRT